MVRPAVFLDRDGVLNRAYVRNGKSYPPDTLDEFQLIEGVQQACEALKAARFLLIVVTNQPDVAAGKQSRAVVDAMHDKLRELLPVDAIYVCFHVDQDNCTCRKPKPGLLLEAAQQYDVDLANSFMVGDRWRDIDAGNAVGCRSFFIDYGYDEQKPHSYEGVVANLLEASKKILGAPQER